MPNSLNTNFFRQFWSKVNDCTRPLYAWLYPSKEKLQFDNKEEWQRQHDEVSSISKRIMLTLIAYCLFCFIALGAPDAELLRQNATIKMPFAGTEVSYVQFLITAPIILISISIYLHIFLGYWSKLAAHDYSGSLPYIFNLNTISARLVSGFIFYWLPCIMLGMFAFKALPRTIGYTLYITYFIIVIIIISLYIRRTHHRLYKTKKGKFFHSTLLVTILCLLVGLINIIFFMDREEFIDVMMGVRKFNLAGSDLSRQDLREVNLKRAYLFKTNFREADLTFSKLNGAFGHEIVFENAILKYASLVDTKLGRSIFDNSDLTEVNLKRAYIGWSSLKNVTFYKADISFANLIYTEMEKANLKSANLTKSDLLGAQLAGTNFTDANLSYARLSLATMNGAILKNADLLNTNLIDVKGLSCNQLRSAKNWSTTYRDKKLACGEKIPTPISSLKNPPYKLD